MLRIEITSLSSSHIKSVVDVHLKAFPNFFLSFLGPRFLNEFYGSFLVDAQGVGYLALSPSGHLVSPVCFKRFFIVVPPPDNV